MAYTHVAHDCSIGDKVILANCATMGGHVQIGDWVQLAACAPSTSTARSARTHSWRVARC